MDERKAPARGANNGRVRSVVTPVMVGVSYLRACLLDAEGKEDLLRVIARSTVGVICAS